MTDGRRNNSRTKGRGKKRYDPSDSEERAYKGADGSLVLTRLRFEEEELTFRIGKQLEVIAANERMLRDASEQKRKFELPVGWLVGGGLATALTMGGTLCCGVVGFGCTFLLPLIVWLRCAAEVRHRRRQQSWDSGRVVSAARELEEAKEQLAVMREQLVLLKKRIADIESGRAGGSV